MQASAAVSNVEENVDTLLTKLEAAHGTKVKILTAEEEEAQRLEKQSMQAKMEDLMHLETEKERLKEDKEVIEDQLNKKEAMLAIEQ